MSILNGPRLNFWGGIRTDVSLPNNSPTIPQGEPDGWPLFDLTTSTLAPGAQSYTDDQLNGMINAPNGDYYTAGGWNHYGQHVVDMQSALISSQGNPGNISTTGDQVGQPVYLLGSVDPVTGQGPVSGPMMVDLDPTATNTTQIFVGGLQIGGSDNIQLLIRANTVCSSLDVKKRILEPEDMDAPGSFRLSGTFQLTFPLSSIVSWNQNSSGLQSIIQAPGATGIVLRFVMFEMCPEMTTEQLDADYAAGRNTPNPSIGRVIGTLAPAFADEPMNCQPGRQLVNKYTNSTGYADLGDSGLLSIDMVNVIPKQNFRVVRDDITSPIGPNANYGPVTITAGATTLTTLDPTSSPLFNYYVYGGIVDLPLSSSQQLAVQKNPLAINAPDTVYKSTLHATESIYRVYADQRNVYLEDHPNGLSITLQVRHLGVPVDSATEIDLKATPPCFIRSTAKLGLPRLPCLTDRKHRSARRQFPRHGKTGYCRPGGFRRPDLHSQRPCKWQLFHQLSQIRTDRLRHPRGHHHHLAADVSERPAFSLPGLPRHVALHPAQSARRNHGREKPHPRPNLGCLQRHHAVHACGALDVSLPAGAAAGLSHG